MTIKKEKSGRVETINDNLNLRESYNLEIKYSGLTGGDVTKSNRYADIKDAEAEQEKALRLIRAQGGMLFKYRNSRVPSIFVFESQFKNMSIKIIEATERIINVKGLLS